MSRWMGFKRSAIIVSLFVRIFLSFWIIKYLSPWHKSGWSSKRKEYLYRSQAALFRETALELGGLLIKLGQFLSSRVDILPRSSISELEMLQDEVRPAQFDDIKKVVEDEFGRPIAEIFLDFNIVPEASASLGQVHCAQLVDGRKVAVKVQRPGIRHVIDIDLTAIKVVTKLINTFTDWGKYADFDYIYEDFASTIIAELDYVTEARHSEIIAQNLKHLKFILIPGIIWEYTLPRVLTMEYMTGIKINDIKSLEKAGLSRQRIARRLIRVYVQQILGDGFFHADPHPGNLFVNDRACIIMLDFGMTGHIPKRQKEMMLDITRQVIDGDYNEVVVTLKRMGFLADDADEELISRAILAFVDQYMLSEHDLGTADLRILLSDLEELIYEFPFRMPSNMTFLGRALGTLYGLCLMLDPDIDFVAVAAPYIREAAGPRLSLVQRLGEKLLRFGGSLLDLPVLAERVYKKADHGSIRVKIPARELQRSSGASIEASRFLGWSISFAALTGSSTYLLVNSFDKIAGAGYVMAFLAMLQMIRSAFHMKRPRSKHPEFIPMSRDRKPLDN